MNIAAASRGSKASFLNPRSKMPEGRQHSRYQVSQLGGARNSRPAPEVVKVVSTFVEEINNRARVATTVGAID